MTIRKIQTMLKKTFRPYYKTIRTAINRPRNRKRIEQSCEHIKSLKNIHEGERCFIIGNGPSLRAEDLDKLKNEVCFGTNCIYQIYNQTEWRPTYYCTGDIKLVRARKREISGVQEDKYVVIQEGIRYPDIAGANYIRIIGKEFYPSPPEFSSNIAECVHSGSTITYVCMQMAAYMGFKEMILLGVDHNYSSSLNPDGTVTRDESVNDHFSKDYKVPKNIPALYKTTVSYQAAKDYADKHGIKIYNATRGGKLEVFARVDFDSLF